MRAVKKKQPTCQGPPVPDPFLVVHRCGRQGIRRKPARATCSPLTLMLLAAPVVLLLALLILFLAGVIG